MANTRRAWVECTTSPTSAAWVWVKSRLFRKWGVVSRKSSSVKRPCRESKRRTRTKRKPGNCSELWYFGNYLISICLFLIYLNIVYTSLCYLSNIIKELVNLICFDHISLWRTYEAHTHTISNINENTTRGK